MNFASGQLMGRVTLTDDQPVALLEVEGLNIEVTQIVVANTNNNRDSAPVSFYHSRETPPVADVDSVLYDAIYVHKSLVLDAPAVGGGIMLVKGDTLMVKGAAGLTVSAYGITAAIVTGNGNG